MNETTKDDLTVYANDTYQTASLKYANYHNLYYLQEAGTVIISGHGQTVNVFGLHPSYGVGAWGADFTNQQGKPDKDSSTDITDLIFLLDEVYNNNSKVKFIVG